MISLFGEEYTVTTVVTAFVLAALTALVIIGGIKRISSVSTVIVPFMAVIYVVTCVSILIYNYERIPGAIAQIFESAFGLRAAAGGALGAMMMAMQQGVARGIFSNESGFGSAPIAAAAAKTNEPVRQGLVSMTGTFIDTIIICSMTGLTIMVTGSYETSLEKGLEGVEVTANAFTTGLPWSAGIGSFMLMLCLAFFAFTTILGWDYYSERCLEYLTGSVKAVMVYKWLYVLAVLIGPFLTVTAVWTIADILNAMMALPNLIALVALNGVIVAETKSYFDRLNSGRLKD